LMAVISSGLLGSVSGSATANTVTTGNFTIPLMKKVGFTPEQAAGIEVAASVGGQWMPPVMGASGFIIAGLIGVPYLRVIAVAAVPAILYFFSVGMMVLCASGKLKLKTLSERDYGFIQQITPSEWALQTLRLAIPIGILLYYIMGGYSPAIAGGTGVLALMGTSLLIRIRGETLKTKASQIWLAFRRVSFTMLPISLACAAAGIVVSSVTMTGLALKFTSLIINVSHGYLLPALVLILTASLFLGMEIPTTGSYIICAVIGAPALVALGVPLLLAHLVS
ncbi:unnamed protein product, partial [marine sediment metagenome]